MGEYRRHSGVSAVDLNRVLAAEDGDDEDDDEEEENEEEQQEKEDEEDEEDEGEELILTAPQF